MTPILFMRAPGGLTPSGPCHWIPFSEHKQIPAGLGLSIFGELAATRCLMNAFNRLLKNKDALIPADLAEVAL